MLICLECRNYGGGCLSDRFHLQTGAQHVSRQLNLSPYYSIPSLNSTLSCWQNAPSGAPPALCWIAPGVPETPPVTQPFPPRRFSGRFLLKPWRLPLVIYLWSMYIDKALIVYKPQVFLAYMSFSDFMNANVTITSAAAGQDTPTGLMWRGGEGVEMYECFESSYFAPLRTVPVFRNSTAWEIHGNPNTQDAYIVGGIVRSYWDDPTLPILPPHRQSYGI